MKVHYCKDCVANDVMYIACGGVDETASKTYVVNGVSRGEIYSVNDSEPCCPYCNEELVSASSALEVTGVLVNKDFEEFIKQFDDMKASLNNIGEKLDSLAAECDGYDPCFDDEDYYDYCDEDFDGYDLDCCEDYTADEAYEYFNEPDYDEMLEEYYEEQEEFMEAMDNLAYADAEFGRYDEQAAFMAEMSDWGADEVEPYEDWLDEEDNDFDPMVMFNFALAEEKMIELYGKDEVDKHKNNETIMLTAFYNFAVSNGKKFDPEQLRKLIEVWNG